MDGLAEVRLDYSGPGGAGGAARGSRGLRCTWRGDGQGCLLDVQLPASPTSPRRCDGAAQWPRGAPEGVPLRAPQSRRAELLARRVLET